jgi:hypothetical protein
MLIKEFCQPKGKIAMVFPLKGAVVPVREQAQVPKNKKETPWN